MREANHKFWSRFDTRTGIILLLGLEPSATAAGKAWLTRIRARLWEVLEAQRGN